MSVEETLKELEGIIPSLGLVVANIVFLRDAPSHEYRFALCNQLLPHINGSMQRLQTLIPSLQLLQNHERERMEVLDGLRRQWILTNDVLREEFPSLSTPLTDANALRQAISIDLLPPIKMEVDRRVEELANTKAQLVQMEIDNASKTRVIEELRVLQTQWERTTQILHNKMPSLSLPVTDLYCFAGALETDVKANIRGECQLELNNIKEECQLQMQEIVRLKQQKDELENNNGLKMAELDKALQENRRLQTQLCSQTNSIEHGNVYNAGDGHSKDSTDNGNEGDVDLDVPTTPSALIESLYKKIDALTLTLSEKQRELAVRNTSLPPAPPPTPRRTLRPRTKAARHAASPYESVGGT